MITRGWTSWSTSSVAQVRPASCVKGHENLPRGGRETCPVTVTRTGSGTHFVIGSGATRHAGLMIRLRSRSKLARPYIWRLIVLIRFTVPSTAPLL